MEILALVYLNLNAKKFLEGIVKESRLKGYNNMTSLIRERLFLKLMEAKDDRKSKRNYK